ncbi:MAG: 5-formyltetrahydrofolate cyclo-ligase [Alphaproteobacteria bacterium]|nr:5-formyltetrahydrofolate cyclo-ligase [Alphaproteobacteria bacterium]
MIQTQLKNIAQENIAQENIVKAKQICRRLAMQQRAKAVAQDNLLSADMRAEAKIIAIMQTEFLDIAGEKISAARIAGYAAMRDELPLWNLLQDLQMRGAITYLPIVIKKATALVFQSWQTGDALVEGNYGEKIPIYDAPKHDNIAPEITPDIILAPLLAFSSDGYRLGYGGGYYDRTIAKIRVTGKQVKFLGIAYSAQEVADLPIDEYDVRLDGVITEQGLRYFV